jgi:hypothetical protein
LELPLVAVSRVGVYLVALFIARVGMLYVPRWQSFRELTQCWHWAFV